MNIRAEALALARSALTYYPIKFKILEIYEVNTIIEVTLIWAEWLYNMFSSNLSSRCVYARTQAFTQRMRFGVDIAPAS